MNETAARRVQDGGAPLLDELHPGWAEKIDLGNFDMSYGNDCVLGQIYRDSEMKSAPTLSGYLNGLVVIFNHVYPSEPVTVLDTIKYDAVWRRVTDFAGDIGFDVPMDDEYGYADLEQVWMAEIQLRRNALVDAE